MLQFLQYLKWWLLERQLKPALKLNGWTITPSEHPKQKNIRKNGDCRVRKPTVVVWGSNLWTLAHVVRDYIWETEWTGWSQTLEENKPMRQERFYGVAEQETERESLSKSQERKGKDIKLGIEKDMTLDQPRYHPNKNLNWLNITRICIKHCLWWRK